jgi:hypothetical protein
MAANREKQDVSKNLVGSSQDDSVPGLEELSHLIHPRGKPSNIATVNTTTAPTNKKKATHYLAEEIFTNLGEAKVTTENLMPGEERIRISKSGIVNSGLKMI